MTGSLPVTIYQVAERAGVSIATVSHTLNRPERVAAATRVRVLDAVDELGFTPKHTAVSLARKGIGRIAVVGPFSLFPTYLTRLTGILAAVRSRNVEVAVYDDDDADPARSPLLDMLSTRGGIDGLIIMGVDPEPAVVARLQDRGIPTVLLDRESAEFTSVTVGDVAGGGMIARHFIARGARTFAFVSQAPPDSTRVTSGELRIGGVVAAVREAGLDDHIHWIITDSSVAGGRAAATDLLALPQRPDAVFAIHDTVAAGLLIGLRDNGIAVGQDLLLAGYDDTELAEALGITTVRQPFAESGRAAAEALLARIAHPEKGNHHIMLSPELVVRSTG